MTSKAKSSASTENFGKNQIFASIQSNHSFYLECRDYLSVSAVGMSYKSLADQATELDNKDCFLGMAKLVTTLELCLEETKGLIKETSSIQHFDSIALNLSRAAFYLAIKSKNATEASRRFRGYMHRFNMLRRAVCFVSDSKIAPESVKFFAKSCNRLNFFCMAVDSLFYTLVDKLAVNSTPVSQPTELLLIDSLLAELSKHSTTIYESVELITALQEIKLPSAKESDIADYFSKIIFSLSETLNYYLPAYRDSLTERLVARYIFDDEFLRLKSA